MARPRHSHGVSSPTIWVFLGALALGLVGCSSPPEQHFPRIINEAAPLQVETRVRFGIIGVMPVSATTNFTMYAPPKRAEVFERVAGRTFDWNYENTKGRGPDGFAAKITSSMIAGLTGGALAAMIKGVPPEEFERSQATLRKALQEQSLAGDVQRELISAITNTRVPGVVVLTDAAVAKAREEGGLDDVSSLAAQGIDTVLEIRIAEISFELKSGFNPDIAFSPQIVAQVRRVLDGSIVYARYFEYRGEERKFTTWAGEDAREFRGEVKIAAREFARAVLEHYTSSSLEAPR